MHKSLLRNQFQVSSLRCRCLHSHLRSFEYVIIGWYTTWSHPGAHQIFRRHLENGTASMFRKSGVTSSFCLPLLFLISFTRTCANVVCLEKIIWANGKAPGSHVLREASTSNAPPEFSRWLHSEYDWNVQPVTGCHRDVDGFIAENGLLATIHLAENTPDTIHPLKWRPTRLRLAAPLST